MMGFDGHTGAGLVKSCLRVVGEQLPGCGLGVPHAQTAQAGNAYLCIQQDGDAASVQVVVIANFLHHLTVRIVITMRHVQPAQWVSQDQYGLHKAKITQQRGVMK